MQDRVRLRASIRALDKFEAFGLTTRPSKKVTPPLVTKCFANLECKVVDTGFVNRYNLFILEVIKGMGRPDHGYGKFMDNGRTIKLKSKMR